MEHSETEDPDLDLDESQGGYEVFRNRAASPRGAADPTWRIGFDARYRDDNHGTLATTLMTVLRSHGRLADQANTALLDIGSGSGPLTEALTDICFTHGITHVVVDSPEMLSHLGEKVGRVKVPGRFPQVVPELSTRFSSFEFILAYSLLQYVVRESDTNGFIDSMTALLSPGGAALLGDIPNRDMRDRQLLADGKIIPEPSDIPEIRDELMFQQLRRIRRQGLHAFITPQHSSELMNLHRENLLIVRPAPYDLSNWIGEPE